MKSFSSARGRGTSVLGNMLAAILLSGFVTTQAAAPTSAEPAAAPTSPQDTARPPVPQSREEWERAMARVPRPKNACSEATYPNLEWREVPCATPRNRPYPPRRGPRPESVGNGTDNAAEVTGVISSATGSFDSVNGVTSETGTQFLGPQCMSPSPFPNTFSLQLNTKPFTTPLCSGSPNPSSCLGWQQFVHSNSSPDSSTGNAFIQFWLIKYNATCPAGWNTYQPSQSSDINCWINGMYAVYPDKPQTIADLKDLKLTGDAGAQDTVTLSTAAGMHTTPPQDSILSLASVWKGVEFNVFGDGCGSEATFNTGSEMVVRTTVHSGTMDAPSCVSEGFTGETNNLFLKDTPAVSTAPAPAIVFTQSSDPPLVDTCATASGIGDTHLTTFGGLLYDFQASGDFVLAQLGPDFVVQTRQVSGAPNWPNASINKAVATRMGKTSVAICLAPARLIVDGKTAQLADGKSLSLPDGVDISRKGNVYVIRDQSGDSVRAELHNRYINVRVGLGRWPADVRGLLANAKTVNEIATRDGIVLTNPFSFSDLYHRYADSWRVPAKESLLSVCGDKGIETGIPKKPFYANNLRPSVYKRARTICSAAGVTVPALLAACTLDVAVIGDETAARVFVGAPAPTAVGRH